MPPAARAASVASHRLTTSQDFRPVDLHQKISSFPGTFSGCRSFSRSCAVAAIRGRHGSIRPECTLASRPEGFVWWWNALLLARGRGAAPVRLSAASIQCGRRELTRLDAYFLQGAFERPQAAPLRLLGMMHPGEMAPSQAERCMNLTRTKIKRSCRRGSPGEMTATQAADFQHRSSDSF